MRINFAKLNHILIPKSKSERDRFRTGRLGKAFGPIAAFYGALSREGRTLALLALIVGGFGLDVRSTELYVLWSALVGLLMGSVLVKRRFALVDVRAKISAPRRVTMGDEMTFAITVTNQSGQDYGTLRVSAPFLPWDGAWTGDEPRIVGLPARASARVEVGARFAERGEHHLDAFGAAALVPLGLALGRPVTTSGCRFIVVPKIANVARLTMAIGRRHQPGGVALASKTGESMDLLGVRPYRVGDPIRDLHARGWARFGTPVVREYQEEYFSRVGVIVDTDVSRLGERGLEAAISLAAGVVAKLSRGEALIDLLVVGDRVHDLTLGRSLGFLEQALDLLACVEPGPALDADALVARLATHLPRLSSVVVVALASDARPLAERIRGYGAGCVTLRVDETTTGYGAARDMKTIAMSAIERGEALSL